MAHLDRIAANVPVTWLGPFADVCAGLGRLPPHGRLHKNPIALAAFHGFDTRLASAAEGRRAVRRCVSMIGVLAMGPDLPIRGKRLTTRIV